MKNKEIARIFEDIGDLLQLKGENQFKIRAYKRVAHSIDNLPFEVEQLVKENRLKEIPGAGEAITGKITELVNTGKLEYYENLKAEFPEGISTLLDIPGIGPRTALMLTSELNIKNIDDLESAILDGRVKTLPRMGNKTAESILHSITVMRKKKKEQRIPIGEAMVVVQSVTEGLKGVPGLNNLTPVGSLRRFKEMVGDIDIMGTADNPEEVTHIFSRLPQVKEILTCGATRASVIVSGGYQVDLRIVDHDSFGSTLQYFTGSKQHNIDLRKRARRMGLKLSEYGITDIATGELEKYKTEEAFYERQKLQYIPPEIREGQNEIEMAKKHTLPDLVKTSDIKGDFHVHSDWSDGQNTIEEMVIAAKNLGYKYIIISDHSAGRGIAHGLDRERLHQQIGLIRQLNKDIGGIRIFTGVEVDIRADGSLDLPDDILSELDFVTAGVHSGMGQGRGQMTRRIIKALENPHVDMLAHPTARLLPNREPVMVDIEAVFQTAYRYNKILEINGMPSRLDLKDTHAHRASNLGIKMAIGTDAHRTGQLEYMNYGVKIARRGWCRPADIINTWNLDKLKAFLKNKE